MAKEKIGSNAIFTGPQKGLSTIGDHCYAYSGIIGITNVETEVLNFSTGKGYITATLQVLNGTTSNEDFLYQAYFNNVIIGSWHCLQVTDKEINIPNGYEIIIPPNTFVKVTGTNTSSGTSRDHSATITGRVYS